jgi:hypothetical protein
MITLVVMSLASLSLIRAVDMGGVIAGNMAFKQTALQVADLGIEAAFNQLNGLSAGAQESNIPAGCGSNCQYYALMKTIDSKGMPQVDFTLLSTSQVTTGVPSGYQVNYVIERLCAGTLPVTSPSTACLAQTNTDGNSKKEGGVQFTTGNSFYFRVTARVLGPRNTVSHAQAIFAF